MDKGSCCHCLSIKTGGTLIGLFVCATFLHNLVCSIVHKELLLYFGINTVIYGTVTFFFIRHKTGKDRKYYLYSKLYFLSYLWLVYVLGNVWNFLFWYCMPEYVAFACENDYKCIRAYQLYGFWMWVSCTLVSAYFAYVLREYKNRMFVTLDDIETDLIDAKI